MIIVGSIIESTGLEVVTVGENGDFVFVVAEIGAAALLVDGVEDMEELADVAEFVVGGDGVKLGEGDAGKA